MKLKKFILVGLGALLVCLLAGATVFATHVVVLHVVFDVENVFLWVSGYGLIVLLWFFAYRIARWINRKMPCHAIIVLSLVSIWSGLSILCYPLVTAGKPKPIPSEAVAALSGINTACKLYQVEEKMPPADFVTVLESGHFVLSDLDGTYFMNESYTIELGDLGKGHHGVLKATATDIESGKIYELTWNFRSRLYEITVQ